MTSADCPTPLPELYRHVWLHACGRRLRLVCSLLLLGASQLLKLALPVLAARAIDALQAGGPAAAPAAGVNIALILGLYCLVWSMHGPARVMERSVALHVRRSVADTLYQRLAAAPLRWHEAHHSGELQYRVAHASRALYSFTQSQFIYLQNAINLAGPLIALTWLAPTTGVAAMLGCAVVAAAILRFDGSLMQLAAVENGAERRYAARLVDFIGNIGAIASLRLQAASRALLDQRLLAVFAPLRRSIVVNEWKWCAVDLATVGLCWGLVVHFAIGAAASASRTGDMLMLGSLFMVYQYAQQACGVLGSIAANYQGLARTQTDFGAAAVILSAPQTSAVVVQSETPWQTLETHQLSFSFRAGRGELRGVSIRLRRGERVALVGASGAGKSTLLRLLAGLFAAESGRVLVDGKELVCAEAELGALATLIPQEAEIFEGTVQDNLTLGAPCSPALIATALRVSALDEVVAAMPHGLSTELSERGCNLSGGQRQRLALARGLIAANRCSLLLLDEPTSALDPVIERHVFEQLGIALHDTCIVASVHRLALLPQFDRVIWMSDGRVVDSGTVLELRERHPAFDALLQAVPSKPMRIAA